MIRNAVCITAFVALLTLAGCAAKKSQPLATPVSLQTLAGVIVERAGVLWFQPCYERLWWQIQDNTEQQELTGYYRQFSMLSNEELYVQLQGGVDPQQDNKLWVNTIDTVGGTAQTCNFRLEGLQFRAASSDPVWVADIMAGQVTVKSVNPLGSYSFQTVNESEKADNASINKTTEADVTETDATEAKATEENGTAEAAERSGGGSGSDVIALYRETVPAKKSLQIKIIQKRCVDSETGTLLPFTAEMSLFGRLYQGCARKGHPVNSEINGFYWYQPEGGSQVMFKLSSDQRVQLVTRDSRGKAVAERGRWQYLQSGKLIFSMRDAGQQEYLMLFTRESDGRLVLQTGSEHLVSYGAAFKLWRPSGLSGGQLLTKLSAGRSAAAPGSSTETLLSGIASEALQPPASSSIQTSLTKSVLTDTRVQTADIDDELLNEIIVHETDEPLK